METKYLVIFIVFLAVAYVMLSNEQGSNASNTKPLSDVKDSEQIVERGWGIFSTGETKSNNVEQKRSHEDTIERLYRRHVKTIKPNSIVPEVMQIRLLSEVPQKWSAEKLEFYHLAKSVMVYEHFMSKAESISYEDYIKALSQRMDPTKAKERVDEVFADSDLNGDKSLNQVEMAMLLLNSEN